MPLRGLWLKEYQQAKLPLWGLFGVVFFAWTVTTILQISNIRQLVAEFPDTKAFFHFHEHGTPFFPLLFALLVIYCGCVLIGGERDRQLDDFALGLPYSRTQIYLTKWL